MSSTQKNSISRLTSRGISIRSRRLSAGAITRRMPDRWAASTFSFRPPIASTRPRSVISPVIAVSWRTGCLVSAEISAVAMRDAGRRAILRDGPLRHVDVQVELLLEVAVDLELLGARAGVGEAACADSCITSPAGR